MPGVLCQCSEVVLWKLLSIQVIFWWICGGESGLPVLFLCHLGTTSWVTHFCKFSLKTSSASSISLRFFFLTWLFWILSNTYLHLLRLSNDTAQFYNMADCIKIICFHWRYKIVKEINYIIQSVQFNKFSHLYIIMYLPSKPKSKYRTFPSPQKFSFYSSQSWPTLAQN